MGACDGEWAKGRTAKGILESLDCVQKKREERELGVMGVNVARPAFWVFLWVLQTWFPSFSEFRKLLA